MPGIEPMRDIHTTCSPAVLSLLMGVTSDRAHAFVLRTQVLTHVRLILTRLSSLAQPFQRGFQWPFPKYWNDLSLVQKASQPLTKICPAPMRQLDLPRAVGVSH